MQHAIPFAKLLGGQGISTKAQAARNKLIKRVGILVIVIVISALFCVWSRVQIVQIGYEITNLQKQSDELAKKASHLMLEVERLKSPGHLQKVAGSVLGMHPPGAEDVILVKQTNK